MFMVYRHCYLCVINNNILVRRSKCGIIQYKSPSTLDNWTPNFFVDLSVLANRDTEDGHSEDTHILFMAFIWFIKLNKLNLIRIFFQQ